MAISIYDLLEAGAHFGHQSRYKNPKMNPYIFGIRNKITIIDLEKTFEGLQKASHLLADIASKRGKVLFVGTKFSAKNSIKNAAERCKMPYVCERWLGGMLTNYKTIRHSIRKLKKLEEQFENEDFRDLTKKEILDLSRMKDKLEKNLGGIKSMTGLPDALVVIDTGKEHIAIREARKLSIPIIGIVDVNNDPDVVDLVIPGNDDALRAIDLYLDMMVEAIVREQAKLPPDLEEEVKKNRLSKKAQAKAEAAKRVVVREKSEAVKETVEKVAESEKSKKTSGKEKKAAPTKKTTKAVAKKTVAKTAEKKVVKKVVKKETETKKTTAKAEAKKVEKKTVEKRATVKKSVKTAKAKEGTTAKKPAAKKATTKKTEKK